MPPGSAGNPAGFVTDLSPSDGADRELHTCAPRTAGPDACRAQQPPTGVRLTAAVRGHQGSYAKDGSAISPRPLFQSQARRSLSAEDNLEDNPGASIGRRIGVSVWRAAH